MELCDQGDLTDFIEMRHAVNPETQRCILSAAEAQYVVQSIVKGLAFLSSNQIMHRDIKLDNIFVRLKNPAMQPHVKELPIDSFEFKLGDFGLAKKFKTSDDIHLTFVGTPLNMGPEVLNKEPYTEKADVWSLGTVLF